MSLLTYLGCPARRARSRVAQLAEQPAVNRQVIGSSPIAGAPKIQPDEICHFGLGATPVRLSSAPSVKADISCQPESRDGAGAQRQIVCIPTLGATWGYNGIEVR